MTLARTALRLATVNALQGANAASGPTIANNRVYDSRIDDFSPETYSADAKPSVIVLTDEDEGDALSDQNGGPPFRRHIMLVIEIGMVQGFDLEIEDGGSEFVPGYPSTDAEQEASLDALEFQVINRLARDPAESSVLFRSFTRIWKYDCHRQVLDDSGVKIAARILTLQVEVSDDQVIVHNQKNTLPVGFNVLPEPLRRVAFALPEGKALNTVIAIAKALTPLELPPLDEIVSQIVWKDLADMNMNSAIASGLDVPHIAASTIGGQIDYQRGVMDTINSSYQKLTLDQSISTLTVVGWPRYGIEAKLIMEIINQGAFSIDGWPSGTVWVGGLPPTITQGAGKRDIVVLTSPDGGATIFGSVVGQDYH